MTDDPFEMLARPLDDWAPDTDPIWDALRRFDPSDPSPLLKLLESKDPIVSRRGLGVFDELGRKGLVVLDAALMLSGHPDNMARNHLMNGVICYPSALNARQASVILKLGNDPFPLVREKVVGFLAYADLQIVEDAIALIDEPQRHAHSSGLEVLRTAHSETQRLFDEAIAREDTWALYAFAALERMTRSGALQQAPEYAGGDYVGEGVVHHIKMLIARRDNKGRRALT